MIVVVQENTPSDALRGMSVFGGSLAGCLGAAVPVVTVSGYKYKNVFFRCFCPHFVSYFRPFLLILVAF